MTSLAIDFEAYAEAHVDQLGKARWVDGWREEIFQMNPPGSSLVFALFFHHEKPWNEKDPIPLICQFSLTHFYVEMKKTLDWNPDLDLRAVLVTNSVLLPDWRVSYFETLEAVDSPQNLHRLLQERFPESFGEPEEYVW